MIAAPPSTTGATEFGNMKLAEVLQPSVFDQGRRLINLLPASTCDKSTHSCITSVSGASGLTKGTRLSKDATKLTKHNVAKGKNECNGATKQGGSILLSVWRLNVKKSVMIRVSDPPMHFQPQDDSQGYDENIVHSYNSSALDSLQDTDAIECTLSDLVPSKFDVDTSAYSPTSTRFDTELNHALSTVDVKSRAQSTIVRNQAADQSNNDVPSGVSEPADATFPDIFNFNCSAHSLLAAGAGKDVKSGISSHRKSPPGSLKQTLVTSFSESGDFSRITKVTRRCAGGDSIAEINYATCIVNTSATACTRLTETLEKHDNHNNTSVRGNSYLTQEGVDDDSICSFIT